MTQDALLAVSVVEIAEDYLGPSASRFMERLAQNHLGMHLSRVTSKDMQKLIRWTRVSAAILTDDTELVSEFVDRLSRL